MTDFAAIILAAGKGTRMKSDMHKVLHPIAGKPMLMHILDEFEGLSPKQTVVVVGDRREQIDAAIEGREVVTALQDPQHGTAHAALQAKGALEGFSGHVLVTFGDVPMVRAETVQRLLGALAEGAKVAVLGFKPEDALQYGRIIADDDGTVRKMVEFKDATEREKKTRMCNSGLIVAHSDDMWPLLEAVDNDNAQGEYYLPDVATGAIARGDKVLVIECEPDEVAGINSRAELAEAEQRWQAARRVQAMDEGATLKAPDTVFFSHDTKLGRDVTVDPHVVFGPGVTVADGVHIKAYTHLEGATLAKGAQAGPFARLRPGAVMEENSFIGNFVEMKKATLGPGAKASHLSRPVELRLPLSDFHTRSAFTRTAFAEVLATHDAAYVPLAPLFCDTRWCAVEDQGVPLYSDDDHLSSVGADRVIDIFGAVFDAAPSGGNLP